MLNCHPYCVYDNYWFFPFQSIKNLNEIFLLLFCYCQLRHLCLRFASMDFFSVCWHKFDMAKQNKNIQIARSSKVKLALVSKRVTDTFPNWKEKVFFPGRSFQVHCEISSCWLVISGQNLHKVLFIFSEKKISNWYDR